MSTLSQLVLAQMAAESYVGPGADSLSVTEANRLRLGNNNPGVLQFRNDPEAELLPGATRMTLQQINRFNELYDVIDCKRNTWSGFSATLLKNKFTNEYVLSFRSTEYQNDEDGGDFQRDGWGGAGNEIAQYGFAIAQIADMEAYYRQLSALGGPLSGAQFRVTGYSLGGHLATVFAEAHEGVEGFLGATTFNSPGRGLLRNGTVADFVNAVYAKLSDPLVQATLVEGTNAEGMSNLQNIYGDASYNGTDGTKGLRQEILDEFRQVYGYAPSGISINGLPQNLAGGGITQVYGHADFGDSEVVANSGIHSNNKVEVFIEDQPGIQGLGVQVSWLDNILGLKSDYGTTHSLALMTLPPPPENRRAAGVFEPKSSSVNFGGLLKSTVGMTSSLAKAFAGAMIILGGSSGFALATSPPGPPPLTIEESLVASSVVIARGVRIHWISPPDTAAGSPPQELAGPNYVDGHAGPILLEARVEEILHCQMPCPKRDTIFINMNGNGHGIDELKRFVGPPKIYIVRRAIYRMESVYPEMYLKEWNVVLRNTRSSQTNPLSIDERSAVESTIRRMNLKKEMVSDPAVGGKK